MGGVRVGGEALADDVGGDLLGFLEGDEGVVEFVVAGDVRHAVAIGSVGEDEEFVLRADAAAEGGFDAVGAAAWRRTVVYSSPSPAIWRSSERMAVTTPSL